MSALPFESRPLLSVGASDDIDDDGEMRARRDPPKHSDTEIPAVDWATIARHTLADVTRALPDARSSELRVKHCDRVITKIESVRADEHEPNLHTHIYRLPRDGPTAGTEIARVRASMEVVATRIRDAITADVKRRLLESLSSSKPTASTTPTTNSVSVSRRLHTASSQTSPSPPRPSHSSSGVQADMSPPPPPAPRNHVDTTHFDRRESEHARREVIGRSSIERQRSDELLDLVGAFMRTLAEADRQEQQRAQATAALLADEDRCRRGVIEELEAREWRAIADAARRSSHDADDAARRRRERELADAAQSEQRERELEAAAAAATAAALAARPTMHDGFCQASDTAEAEALAEERQRSAELQRLRDEAQRHSAEQLCAHLLDAELRERALVAEWERDARSRVLQQRQAQRAALQQRFAERGDAARGTRLAVERTRFWGSFFETWRCFALMRRQENIRLDQERHQRILQYTLDLQEQQLNGSLDSIVVDSNHHVSSFAQPSKHAYVHAYGGRTARGVSPAPSSLGMQRHYEEQQEEAALHRSSSPGVSPVPRVTHL